MKAKIVLSAILVMVVCVFQGHSQHHPTSDDKVLIMQEIENLSEATGRQPFKEWWKEARKVEDFSLLLGYSSYGAPWGSDALHGGTLGVSNNHFMMSFDFGFGSMIDETAYNNSEAYDYLKTKSTQSFGLLSVHYYMIKYLSFGVGLGTHSELRKVVSTQIEPYDSYSVENDNISFENKWLLSIRLGAKAYIPITDLLSVYLSGNYDIVPSGTRKSNFGLGVGIKINME